MAFFPRNFYAPEASFTPLFRLLDDFDSYSRQSSGSHGRRNALPHWQPKFDVRETDQSYELHGELPGINKENVQIEFTEPQTMVVRGKVERSYSSGTTPAGQVEDAAVKGSITEGEELQSSHQATVEDDFEDVATTEGVNTPTTASEEVVKKTEDKPQNKAKYWLTERSIGEFSRSFSFPSRVDQDSVTASFKDGILSVVVPKAKKHESRRINVD